MLYCSTIFLNYDWEFTDEASHICFRDLVRVDVEFRVQFAEQDAEHYFHQCATIVRGSDTRSICGSARVICERLSNLPSA